MENYMFSNAINCFHVAFWCSLDSWDGSIRGSDHVGIERLVLFLWFDGFYMCYLLEACGSYLVLGEHWFVITEYIIFYLYCISIETPQALLRPLETHPFIKVFLVFPNKS